MSPEIQSSDSPQHLQADRVLRTQFARGFQLLTRLLCWDCAGVVCELTLTHTPQAPACPSLLLQHGTL